MEFIIPKKRHMNLLYNLTKKLLKKGFFKFIETLGQRVFFMNGKNFSYVVVVSPDEYKLDIFYGEEGFLSCHHLFNGDERGIHMYSVDSLGLEISPTPLFGSEYYLDKFKHYTENESTWRYYSRKAGQPLTVIDMNEAMVLINVLEKLFVIQKRFKKESFDFVEDMVFVFEFKNKNKFTYSYSPLINFDFTPDIKVENYSKSVITSKDNAPQIIPGILHIGMIDSFKICESYNNLAPFEFGLTAQFFYAITEEGELEHSIFTTHKEELSNIMATIAVLTLNKIGFYDTVVTDNFLVYSALLETLTNFNVTLKYEPHNDFNIFITNFMIKLCQYEKDIDIIDELINTSKEDIKNLLLENIDNLYQFNEMFFNAPIEELSDEEITEDEEDDDDDGGFVS